jgi:hypothetical protein
MEDQPQIKLDGTYGPGVMAEVKVYTRMAGDPKQLREETFLVPYMFLDVGKIATMHLMNLYAGFSIVNDGKPSQLKELGL